MKHEMNDQDLRPDPLMGAAMRWAEGEVPMDEVDIVCSGINHQTWYIDLRLNGRKVEKDEIISALEGPVSLTECGAQGAHPPAGTCELETVCRVRGHWRVINRTRSWLPFSIRIW